MQMNNDFDIRSDDASQKEAAQLFDEMLRSIFEAHQDEQFVFIGEQTEGVDHDFVKVQDGDEGEKVTYILSEQFQNDVDHHGDDEETKSQLNDLLEYIQDIRKKHFFVNKE